MVSRRSRQSIGGDMSKADEALEAFRIVQQLSLEDVDRRIDALEAELMTWKTLRAVRAVLQQREPEQEPCAPRIEHGPAQRLRGRRKTDELRDQIERALRHGRGLRIAEIASAVGVPFERIANAVQNDPQRRFIRMNDDPKKWTLRESMMAQIGVLDRDRLSLSD